jgi:hypothetical protein
MCICICINVCIYKYIYICICLFKYNIYIYIYYIVSILVYYIVSILCIYILCKFYIYYVYVILYIIVIYLFIYIYTHILYSTVYLWCVCKSIFVCNDDLFVMVCCVRISYLDDVLFLFVLRWYGVYLCMCLHQLSYYIRSCSPNRGCHMSCATRQEHTNFSKFDPGSLPRDSKNKDLQTVI